MKKDENPAMNFKGTIFENAKVIRAIQHVDSKNKTEENLVYSVELELNKVALILTMRVGNEFTEITVVDKKTGKMLEYLAEQNGKLEFVKSHNMNMEQIKRLLTPKKET
ncbi:MAG: hypothetical protein PHS02_01685 [Candidatus ainarchaeum sp.]|nr:hypothetical protein [Candidatus ainarchaeum sp.]